MNCKIDLHCHTTASDGKLSPEQLIERALEQNVQVLAITDHDTVAGFRQALEYVEGHQKDIRLISGIELSCVWSGMLIHIVGLNFNPEHPAMVQAETRQNTIRYQRAQTIAERLSKKLQHPIPFSEVENLAGGTHIGRPHFAQYLVEQGLVSSMAAAFEKYLGAGKVGDVKTGWPTLSEVVHWIVEAGGIAVMAHAHRYKMTRTKLRACLHDFTDAGGQGLEVAYSNMDSGQQQLMARMAEDFQLLGSCGSDFHGPNRFGLELGRMTAFPQHIEPVWKYF